MSNHRADVPVVVGYGECPTNEEQIKSVIYNEMHHVLEDIEFRVRQAYDVSNRSLVGAGTGSSSRVYAEDTNVMTHLLTGYTVTANSPSAGNIAWSSLHVVYSGVDYTITDGNTVNGANPPWKYMTFVKPASYTAGSPIALVGSLLPPTLAQGDTIVFYNNGGVPTAVPGSSKSVALFDGTVTNSALGPGVVTADKTTVQTHLLF